MNASNAKVLFVLVAGFFSGVGISTLPPAIASQENASAEELSTKKFQVSIDEVRQKLVFADEFTGSYSRTFTLSDGTRRTIELRPMLHNGMKVVELKDTGFLSYMALDGTTTNGDLMVQVRDVSEGMRRLKEQGWPFK